MNAGILKLNQQLHGFDASFKLRAYKKLGSRFSIDGLKFDGMAIASKNTIYLVVTGRRDNKEVKQVLGHVGGIVGRIMIGAATAMATSMKKEPGHVKAGLVRDLPASVTQNGDWPLSGFQGLETHHVVQIDRDNVDIIHHSRFTNLLRFKYSGSAFSIVHQLFHGAEMRGYLVATGWPLQWGRQKFNC